MLEKIPLFSEIEAGALQAFEKKLQTHQYSKNRTVIRQGDEGSTMYLVLSGRLKVVVINDVGQEVLLDFLEASDYFGELSVLDSEVRSASVIAVETSLLLPVKRATLMDFIEKNPEFNMSLLKALSRRIRGTSENLGSLTGLDVYGRVARLLLKKAEEENGVLITPRFLQKDIGDMVGASREMVSKILGDLKAGGYISINAKRIRIHRKLPRHW